MKYIIFITVHYVEIRFKNFLPIGLNISEKFACLCRRTLSPMHTIFSTVHSISNMKLEHAQSGGYTDKPNA